MLQFSQAKLYGETTGGGDIPPQLGRAVAGRDIITVDGKVWSAQGATAFLLIYRWLRGENIDAFISWLKSIHANTARVLGMVHWPQTNQSFGPNTPGYWEQLPRFIDY